MARQRKNASSGMSAAREQVLGISRDVRRAQTERHDTAFVIGALIGGLAGSTAALFRAPQAGQRTREQLAGYVDTAVQRVMDVGARIGLGSEQEEGSVRSRAAVIGSRARVDLRPASLGTSDAVAGEMGLVGTGSTDGALEQEAEPVSGLDPALALTPDLAGTGTATTSVGPEVADEAQVMGDDVPPNMDR